MLIVYPSPHTFSPLPLFLSFSFHLIFIAGFMAILPSVEEIKVFRVVSGDWVLFLVLLAV